MKTLEYLHAKVEALEKELGLLRKFCAEELKELDKKTTANTRWILLATGFGSGVIFLSRALEWWAKHGPR